MMNPDGLVTENELVQLVIGEFAGVTGIQLGEPQITFVRSRISRRMRSLEIETPHQYWDYFCANRAKETPKLVSLLTTHHTFFFRESPQFEFLLGQVLPALIRQMKSEGRRHINVWSAGCSRGQEVYTISMFLQHHLKKMAPDFTFEILGTDICTESIAIAKNGVYNWDELKEIPSIYMDGNWMRGRASVEDYAKARPSIKSSCNFEIINLKNIGESLGGKKFDLIFCRNVFIYFISQRIKVIASDLLRYLNSSGFLCLGLSENLVGMELPVSFLGNSIYRHASAPSIKLETNTNTQPKKILKVLCVDDSTTVLKLLKNLLTPAKGFEVVGTALNGLEAKEFIKNNQVDVMTLDIHMPEQNGIDYLRNNFNSHHPAVVMVSTVAREEGDLALQALNMGARDYVEKPSMGGLVQKGDELRFKLLCAYHNRQPLFTPDKIDFAFRRNITITQLDRKLRIIIASFSNLKQLKYVISELTADQPPTVVFWDCPTNLMESMTNFVNDEKHKTELYNPIQHKTLTPGIIYVAEFRSQFDEVKTRHGNSQTSILVLGVPSEESLKKIKGWMSAHLTVQDLEDVEIENYRQLRQAANEIVPYTSFRYTSDVFFSMPHTPEHSKQVVLAKSLIPEVFEGGEVVKISCNRSAIITLFHPRKGRGAILVAPEEILIQDSLLLEQKLNKLVELMRAQGDSLKGKIAGSSPIVKKITEFLMEKKVTVVFARELIIDELEAYFFTDSGKLRLPKELTQTKNSEEVTENQNSKKQIMIVEGSKVFGQLLRGVIEEDGTMVVCSETGKPHELNPIINESKPDVIVLDLDLTEDNGIEVLKRIVSRHGISTIVFGLSNKDEGKRAIEAMEYGALEYIQKPRFAEISLLAPLIREKIKMASFIPPKKRRTMVSSEPQRPKSLSLVMRPTLFDQKSIIAIGASTGGTAAIKNLISTFPENIPAVLITQHIPPVFSKAFAERLNEVCRFTVKEAQNGDIVLPGYVYIAPGDLQMEICQENGELKIKTYDSGTSQLHKPSVDVLFESMAKVVGKNGVGVLLTGMGRDGAQGLLQMRNSGAKTLAQDKDSSAVFGMPKAAIDLGAVEKIVSLDDMPAAILSQVALNKKAA